VLFFRNNAGYYVELDDRPRFRQMSRVLGGLIASFNAHIASSKVIFATDSERLADEYEALSSVRPEVFPSPRVGPRPAAGSQETKGAEIPILRFSCLGPARFEKGIDILQDAIKLVLMRRRGPSEDREPHFTIQWNMAILDDSGRPYHPDPSLVADHRLEFIDAPLDAEAYQRELLRADCMILPYRRSSYFARISGVAVEAVTAGIPIIFTEDTWCATLVETSGAGLGVPDGDAAALAEAIEKMARSYQRYRSKALEMAEIARSVNSAENFICKLWGLAAARGAMT
jgi:glycosyltransferase involved in cell wall biosynthesis